LAKAAFGGCARAVGELYVLGRVNEGLREMITVFGEGRGFRVVWLLEEMGYRIG
jgi:hypothetical protein